MKTKIILTTFLGTGTILFLAAAIGLRAAEEEKLTVGDPAVNGSFIKPYQNIFQISLQKKDAIEPTVLATWSDQVEAIQLGGRSVMKRTQVAHYIKKEITVTGERLRSGHHATHLDGRDASGYDWIHSPPI